MAHRRAQVPAKTRTRQHIIADLSFNDFERHVLESGHVAEPVWHDYGYDAIVFTYTTNGELEPGQILVQLKATDRLNVLQDGKTLTWSIDRRDLKVWLQEHDPVILIVYDAQKRRAFWLNVQQYFRAVPTKTLFVKRGTIAVRIPMSQRIHRRAIEQFVAFRDESMR